MSLLNLVFLLILFLRKIIGNPEANRLLKISLWLGVIYWALIFLSVSVFKMSPQDLPMPLLIPEFAVKILTTFLFFKALRILGREKGRNWLLAMIAVGTIDLLMNLVGLFL